MSIIYLMVLHFSIDNLNNSLKAIAYKRKQEIIIDELLRKSNLPPGTFLRH
jgi:hypothetical protein